MKIMRKIDNPKTLCLKSRLILSFILVLMAFIAEPKAILAQSLDYDTPATNAILVDLLSGETLFEKNADERVAPASMTKMMTVYILFERLKNGVISLDDEWQISEKAWRMGGSKMFLEVGKTVKVEDLLYGIIVQSGNDATIVAAESLAGSEEQFAELMTAKAKELGMKNTAFKNASGWPDEGHYSTARDLSILGSRLIIDFPNFYRLYREREFTYSNIRQSNRNPILGRVNGADGIKTGHVDSSGYSFTGSAQRGERRLVMVIQGLESTNARRQEATRFLEWGFNQWGYYEYYAAGEAIAEMPVWLGRDSTVQIGTNTKVGFNFPRHWRDRLQFTIRQTSPIPAPIKTGDILGQLDISTNEGVFASYPLIALNDVPRLGAFGRIGAAISYFLFGE